MRRAAVCTIVLALMSCTGSPALKPAVGPPPPHAGGEATFGAEQWPECLNPITSCASAYWTHWSVLQHVLPKAMELDEHSNYVPSWLIGDAPTLENGGLREGPPFTVTYSLNPDAEWADATRMTSRDFVFTWRAWRETTGAYGSDIYEHITKVEAVNEGVVRLTFDAVRLDWAEAFGGTAGYVLERAAFSPELQKHPDLAHEMLDEIPFSGGPFRLTEWDRDHATFVRNPHHFGEQALLDRVTFVRILDQPSEFAALRNGTVDAIFPQFPDTLAALRGPHVATRSDAGMYIEALWLFHTKPPLDDPTVREALMYAVDREAVVDAIVRPADPDAEVDACGLVATPSGPWCDTEPFARFRYDPRHAREILEEDGYDCSAMVCERDGNPLTIPYSTFSTNVRRTKTQQLIIDGARAAGFDLTPHNFEASVPFPGPVFFVIAQYAAGATADPSVTAMFDCDSIFRQGRPGSNWTGWCNRDANALMRQSDRELDPDARLQLMNRIYEAEADDFVSLPLYAQPVVTAWRTDRIAGPIGTYASTELGAFYNMSEWYVPSST